MDMFDFAGLLFGGNRNRTEATTVTATGAASSADGVASITLDADVTPAEDVGEDADQTVIDLPTSPDVDEGDELIVTLVGDGPLKTPIVTANPGSGDRMRALANSAKTIADAAQAVAEAVGQHFWSADDGIHVTEATQEDWDESHSGANVLINSIGQLFRDGLNNLLTLTTENGARALTIWDGLGNAAENVRAIIGEVIRLGKTSDKHILIDSDSIDMCDESGVLWSMTSDGDGAPLITTENDGYYVGSYVAGDGTEAPRHSNIHGLTGFLQDFGDGAAAFVSASAQYAGALKDAEITLFSPSASSAATESRAVIVADRLSLLIDKLTVSGSTLGASHVASMLTTESANLTRGSGASAWTNGVVRRSGKVVTVTINGVKLSSALASGGTSGTITTIPEGYRPSVMQRVPACVNATGNYGNAWAVVGSGGGVLIRNTSPTTIAATSEISISVTYIID